LQAGGDFVPVFEPLDIAGAKAFGFICVWVNRAGAPDEYPDLRPEPHRERSARVSGVRSPTGGGMVSDPEGLTPTLRLTSERKSFELVAVGVEDEGAEVGGPSRLGGGRARRRSSHPTQRRRVKGAYRLLTRGAQGDMSTRIWPGRHHVGARIQPQARDIFCRSRECPDA